jgi:hypothetical protein
MHTTTVDPRILSRLSFVLSFGQRHKVNESIVFLWEGEQGRVDLNFSGLDPIVGTLKQARGILYTYGKPPIIRVLF